MKHASLTKNTYNIKSTQQTKVRFSRLLRPGNGVGLFWYNGNGWKSEKIDEASKKGKKILKVK